MCIYIGIEDLVANALIELVEKSEKREVLFKQLDEYGAQVIKYLMINKNRQCWYYLKSVQMIFYMIILIILNYFQVV